uniref:Putative ovule protein n=1 Tax=Solanum chacoense TaxID=4108 RepID=A0A0V0HU92_SOLCH
MKWLWRYASEEPLWKEVIRQKYREDSWTTNPVATPYGCRVWRSIRNLWPRMWNNSRLKVANGRKISFWKDNWLGQGTLQQSFPDMYILNPTTRGNSG